MAFFRETPVNFLVIDKLVNEINLLPDTNSLAVLKGGTHELFKYFNNAPTTYKCYLIPKKSGGHRLIANPPFAIKVVQRELINILKNRIQVSDSAYAYVEGKGIKANALEHKNSNFFLKMDLVSYFNSIDDGLLSRLIKASFTDISMEEINLLNNLLLWEKGSKLCLSVGAPSSPFISNAIMYDFDNELKNECMKKKITFTRYADDLTFSTNKKNQLFQIPHIVEKLLEKHFSTKLTVNHKKTKFSSKAHNRRVTGITITNQASLSLGREKKRIIRSMVHNYYYGKASVEDILKLQGYLSFSKYIEPTFFNSLKDKYGKDIISMLLRVRKNND